MAVSIDTVYQRVQALVNKEQRGYLTPTEFNLFANKAQMDIFEQYFYDSHQFKRRPGSKQNNIDPIEMLNQKIRIFKERYEILQPAWSPISQNPNGGVAINLFLPNLYSLDSVSVLVKQYNGQDVEVICPKIELEDISIIKSSPLLKPSFNRPVYYVENNDGVNSSVGLGGEAIKFLPIGDDYLAAGLALPSGIAYYTRTPNAVQWNGYNIGGAFAYNASNSVDFELHSSEQTNLVNNILKSVGISLKDPSLYQAGQVEETKDINQEKQ